MVSLPIHHLPRDITRWSEAAGIGPELEETLSETVFCSFIHTVRGNDWVPGFVIDQTNLASHNPFHFPAASVEALKSRKFIGNPYRTAFLNFSHPSGKPLTGQELFVFLAYAVGYLKYPSKTMDYECKKAFGKAFVSNAIRRLSHKQQADFLVLLAGATETQEPTTASQMIGGTPR